MSMFMSSDLSDEYDDDFEEGDQVSQNPRTRNLGAKGKRSDIPFNQREKKYRCHVCGYNTPYPKDLTRHHRKHTGEKPFACEICSRTYSRMDKVTEHVKRAHKGIKPFKCSHTDCSQAFATSSGLRKHQLCHTGEKPHKCQVCPYSARDISQLKIHLRSHTGDCPYVCMHADCDGTRSFKTSSDLTRHMRIHTGDRPYACLHCEFRAVTKGNLNVHMRKHNKLTEPSSSVTSNVEVEKISTVIESSYSAASPELERTSRSIPVKKSVIVPPSQETDSTISTATTQTELEMFQEEDELLQYLFACRLCRFKGDTLREFNTHMTIHHTGAIIKPTPQRYKLYFNKKPRIARLNVVKPYQCTFLRCKASFVHEDSLRCHSRQHSIAPRPMPVFTIKPTRLETEQATTNINLLADASQSHEQQDYQQHATVITEMPMQEVTLPNRPDVITYSSSSLNNFLQYHPAYE